MKASSTSNALPFVPSAPSAPSTSRSNSTAPSPVETKTSFAEVLHQQSGNDSTRSADMGTIQKSDTTNTAPTDAILPPDPPAAIITSNTDKSIATALKTSTSAAKEAPVASAVDSTTATTPKLPTKATVPATSDLATLMVQAAAQAAQPNAKVTSTVVAPNPTKTNSDSTPSKGAPTPGSGLDLTTLIAQAALATSNAASAAHMATANAATDTAAAPATPTVEQITTAAAATGTETPSMPSLTATTPSSGKEKKSALSRPEGSFLQSGTEASNPVSTTIASLSASVHANTNNSGNQNVSDGVTAKKSAMNSIAVPTSDPAGTANDKRDAAMNATLNMTGLAAGAEASPALRQQDADVHIQLGSNNDFNEALKHVMNVAELSQTNSTQTPMRIAMELQTPPGAIVNIYVSKQDDGYRAQLSTNDPQALSWVQDKLGELRNSNDLGVNVKWLPAQVESTSTTVSSTSNSSNDGLAWDRGGQNQQGQQQQNEQQSARQKKADIFPGMPSLANNSFMTQLTSLGRAA